MARPTFPSLPSPGPGCCCPWDHPFDLFSGVLYRKERSRCPAAQVKHVHPPATAGSSAILSTSLLARLDHLLIIFWPQDDYWQAEDAKGGGATACCVHFLANYHPFLLSPHTSLVLLPLKLIWWLEITRGLEWIEGASIPSNSSVISLSPNQA